MCSVSCWVVTSSEVSSEVSFPSMGIDLSFYLLDLFVSSPRLFTSRSSWHQIPSPRSIHCSAQLSLRSLQRTTLNNASFLRLKHCRLSSQSNLALRLRGRPLRPHIHERHREQQRRQHHRARQLYEYVQRVRRGVGDGLRDGQAD